MSSLRSHFRSANSQRPSTSDSQNKIDVSEQRSRSKAPVSDSSKPRQASKLAKRTSRSIPIPANNQTRAQNMQISSQEIPTASKIGRYGQSGSHPNSSPSMMSSTSQSGLQTLSPPPVLRTPSLVSGSSASTFDSPRSNVLRRKPSTIERFVARKRSEALGIELDRSTIHSRTDGYNDAMDDSVFGISMPTLAVSNSYSDFVVPAISSLSSTQNQHHDLDPRDLSSPDNEIVSKSPSTNSVGIPTKVVAEKRASKIERIPATARSVDTVRSSQSSAKTKRLPQLVTTVPQPAGAITQPRTITSNSASGTKSATPSRRASKAMVNPPELAHLDVEVPVFEIRSLPPPRPSRDGTPDMLDLSLQSPVIQSDMKALPNSAHRRSPSRESFSSISSQGIRSRLGMSPRLTSKLSSPPLRSTPSPSIKDIDTTLAKSASSTSLASKHTPVSATESTKPRFGFLSRKSKAESAKNVEKPKREPRKGPAAGTGHERYGKFGFRGRSGSISSSGNGRSPSTDSQTSVIPTSQKLRTNSMNSNDGLDMDDFLRERLKPRVLRGSGSNFSTVTSPSISSAVDSTDDVLIGFEYSHNRSESSVLASSTADRSSQAAKPGQFKIDPTRSDSGDLVFEPETIADETLPTSFNVSPPLADITTTLSGIDIQEGLWLQPAQAAKKSGRKWNFLQRAQSAAKNVESVQRSNNAGEARSQMFDNAADCALLDQVDSVNLKEAQLIATGKSKTLLQDKTTSHSIPRVVPYGERHRSLLPSPLDMEPRVREARGNVKSKRDIETAVIQLAVSGSMTPRVKESEQPAEERQASQTSVSLPETLSTPDLTNGSESPRIPRLSPIGRIPRVVSKRDRERRLPDASFSRPFVSSQPKPPNAQPPGALYTQIRGVASPTDSTIQSPEELSARSPPSGHPSHQYNVSVGSNGQQAQNLFAFPSRQNSCFSYTSSSDTNSINAFSYMHMAQGEDVWNEYDEFMDQVTPDESYMPGFHYLPPISTDISPYAPSHSALYFGLPPTKEPAVALPAPPRSIRGTPTSAVSQQSIVSAVQGKAGKDDAPSISSSTLHQQIAAQLRISPRSTFRESITSSRDSRVSAHSRSASLPDANVRSSHTSFASNSQSDRRSQRLSKETDLTKDLQPSIQLKLDLLMASKSLTFGRVLFSPAHNEMKFADEPRVLVLDGLGSEWSHFVALSYPNATVYNLGPIKRQAKTQEGSKARSNHRSINHPSIGAQFPFPRGFFTTAVLRFPVATTDQEYHACMCEIRRVLRPGGHLEVSVIDIDMSNMGNRARKAVRGLKTRMQQHEENVSLRSLSDLLLQSIGKRGFENVQRCVIGVPITGRLPREHSNSVSSGSSGRLTRMDSNSNRRESKTIAQMAAAMSSVDDNNVEETEDEKMTKMVARVGRWWYTTSYEKMLLNTDSSIWSDNALLRECQVQGTSFKLLICCAQKPLQSRRRTASV